MRFTHTSLLLFTLALSAHAKEPRVVEVKAMRFEYAPSELHLKKGEPVVIRFTTEDVAHGFSARKLKLSADILPGKPAEVRFTPEEAGTFTAVCDHYCGSGHGGMHMKIVVED